MANYLPFNSISHDRVYKAEDWAWYFSTFIGNGVFPQPTTGLQVVAGGDMDITVKPGYGFINGYAFRNQTDYNITLDNADGVMDRIDRVVLRWDLSNRNMVLAVKKGSYSQSPVAQTLTRTADIYELALADVAVGHGVTTITQSHITDQRINTDLCGIVEGTVSQIDWATLTAQLTAYMAEFTEETSEWYAAEQDTFEDWVATLHDILDSETAGHLQNEIEALQGDVGDLEDAVEALKTLEIDIASFSSLPVTVQDSRITADHVVDRYVLSDCTAKTGDWTVTKSAGSLTITGTIDGTTTLTLYLNLCQSNS